MVSCRIYSIVYSEFYISKKEYMEDIQSDIEVQKGRFLNMNAGAGFLLLAGGLVIVIIPVVISVVSAVVSGVAAAVDDEAED